MTMRWFSIAPHVQPVTGRQRGVLTSYATTVSNMTQAPASFLPRRRRVLLAGAAAGALSGCGLPLMDKPARAEPWDLGPPPDLPADAPARDVVLALNTVQAPSALDTTRVMYRLLYAGTDQQPRPYAQARWMMAPPQLFEQRLATALATTHAVVEAGSGLEQVQLQVELQEFAQYFESPQDSKGVVRVRALAVAPGDRNNRLLGQRTLVAEQPARTPDAAGGVRALREATDDIIGRLASWVDDISGGRR